MQFLTIPSFRSKEKTHLLFTKLIISLNLYKLDILYYEYLSILSLMFILKCEI